MRTSQLTFCEQADPYAHCPLQARVAETSLSLPTHPLPSLRRHLHVEGSTYSEINQIVPFELALEPLKAGFAKTIAFSHAQVLIGPLLGPLRCTWSPGQGFLYREGASWTPSEADGHLAVAVLRGQSRSHILT